MPRKYILDLNPIYYVYVLFDWLGIPRYIGKSKNGSNRENYHEKLTDPNNQLKNEFIEQTWIMLGEIPKIRVHENLSEGDAFATEIALISVIGRIDLRTGTLTNMTKGGEGGCGLSPISLIERGKAISYGRLTKSSAKERSEKAKQSHALRTSEERSNIAILRQARKTPEERSNAIRLGRANMTTEERKATTNNARLIIANRPVEERKASARKAHAALTPKERSDRAKRAAETCRKNKKIN